MSRRSVCIAGFRCTIQAVYYILGLHYKVESVASNVWRRQNEHQNYKTKEV